MYNTFNEDRPSKPAVTTSQSAEVEFNNWLAQNNMSQIEDRDGLIWDLVVDVNQLPHPTDLRISEWQMVFRLGCRLTGAELMRTGTCDSDCDARLIDLLGSESVQVFLKPIELTATTLEDTRARIVDQVARLRQDLATADLKNIKRQLVGRYIDRGRDFAIPAFVGFRKDEIYPDLQDIAKERKDPVTIP